MDNDIQYFQAVIDTANLISTWLKNKNEDIRKILSALQINLEAKYGPFTSKLSNQIGMNETLGLKSPDSYWRGVSDTLSLIKNFLNWKESINSPRSLENFLLEIVNKSNIRIEPDESPLVSALGILFESEFSEPIPKVPESQSEQISFISPPEPSPAPITTVDYQKETFNNPSLSVSPLESTNSYQTEPLEEKITNVDDEFDPNEFIDDDKFLDQFIADSISPEEKVSNQEEIDKAGREYLRSALAELTESVNSMESEKEVEIQFKDVQNNNESDRNVILESDDVIDDALDSKDSSRLLSSSLRDALRMLREED